MTNKKVLVRDGHHMRPMLAILIRHNLGSLDQYGRGRWISEKDLPAILDAIRCDPTARRGGTAEDMWLCQGTNRHNAVWFSEFRDLFN